MVNYIKAKQGYKFALTEFGLEQAHVRAKFEEKHPLFSQYQKSVPKAWVEKGYVEEVQCG